jgi:hypothetical protein
MKKFVGLIVVLAVSSQSAIASGTKNGPDSPASDVLMYYKDGNEVVVKNCGTNHPVIKSRSDCGGPENRVPISVFQRALDDRRLISAAYTKVDSSNFISISSIRESYVYSALEQFDASKGECGTDEILNGTYDHPGGAPKVGDAAWLENLWMSSANASVVGGWGARVKNCAGLHYCPIDAAKRGLTCIKSGPDAGEISWTNPNGQKVIWKLVARKRDRSTGKFYEVWQDSHSLKLWGDALDGGDMYGNQSGAYSHYSAVELNATGKVVGEKACAPTNDPQQAAIARTANAGVDDKSWGLPTSSELLEADADGMSHVLPNMNSAFWSATLSDGGQDRADTSVISQGLLSLNHRLASSYDRALSCSVRCVGR